MFEIRDAVNDRPRFIIGIQGESGTGKTLTALKLARGLVGKEGIIVVIDSEGGRSKMYASDPEVGGFKILELRQPHSSERYKLAVKEAEKIAHAIIIDSASHEHEGMLEYADAEAKRLAAWKNVDIAKWQKPKGERKRFYSAFMSSPVHIILTMRIIVAKDLQSKPIKEIRKVQCDQNLPYEMDILIELNKQNQAEYIKVPQPLHKHIENFTVITPEHGARLAGTITPPSADLARINQEIVYLEDAANNGTETFQTALEAAKRGCKNESELEVLRSEYKRILQIAVNADAANAPDPEEGTGDSEGDGLFKGRS